MAKVYVFLAEGFETVEALAVVDVLRRAKVEVVTVAVGEDLLITSAQKIAVKADKLLSEELYEDGDVVFLPGGMPGTRNLEADEKVVSIVRKQYEAGKIIAAICAAPSVFGHMNLLNGRKATCFPGFEKDLLGAEVVTDRVVVDENVITSRGMGTAIDLGLVLVEQLVNKETADTISSSIQYK